MRCLKNREARPLHRQVYRRAGTAGEDDAIGRTSCCLRRLVHQSMAGVAQEPRPRWSAKRLPTALLEAVATGLGAGGDGLTVEGGSAT